MAKFHFNSRRFKYGSLATAISVVFVAVIILINIIASVITDKYPINIDLTRENAFQLSPTSVDYIKNLDTNVEIIVLTDKSTFSQVTGSYQIYFQQIQSIIEQYGQYSDHITVEYVDIIKNPAFYGEYPDMDLSDSDILVRSDKKVRKVNLFDMFEFDYQTGALTGSKAEQLLTPAVMGVVSTDNVVVDVLTGHNEKELTAFTELLVQNNYEVITQNLVTEEINPDADVLLIAAPMRDFDDAALKKLDAFLNNDNRYGKNLLYFADQEQPELPMLEAFLAEWGVQVGNGLVFETDVSKIYTYGTSSFAAVEYANEDYAAFMGSKELTSVVPFPRQLEVLFDAKVGITTSTLLQFSSTAGVKPADAGEDWQIDENALGNVPAVVLSTNTTYDGMTPLQSNVAVCSSTYAVDAVILSNPSFNNSNYFINMLNTMTEREDVITIESKDMSSPDMGLSARSAIVIGVIFTVGFPLVTILIAIVVWLRRRHR